MINVEESTELAGDLGIHRSARKEERHERGLVPFYVFAVRSGPPGVG